MKKGIAKAGLLATLGLGALGIGGAQGATLNGCIATSAEPAMALTCSYLAGAPGQFVNTTRAHFTIKVFRGDALVQTIEGRWNLPVSGAIAAIAGDTVQVSIDRWGPCAEVAPPLSLPPYPDAYSVCPANGAVSAGDQ
jgi:hypothetical protein